MHGLPQEVRITLDTIVPHLVHYGYHTQRKNPVLWTHDSCPINLTLAFNDFSVKYPRKEHALHLKAAL